MIKREISYEDFDGNPHVETFWFHLTKTEAFEISSEYPENVEQMIKKMVASDDRRQIVEIFKKIVLRSYGQRSEDAKRFIKTPEATLEFSQSAAFDALFIELVTNDKVMADFIVGIMPNEVQGSMREQIAQTPLAPPTLSPAQEIPK